MAMLTAGLQEIVGGDASAGCTAVVSLTDLARLTGGKGAPSQPSPSFGFAVAHAHICAHSRLHLSLRRCRWLIHISTPVCARRDAGDDIFSGNVAASETAFLLETVICGETQAEHVTLSIVSTVLLTSPGWCTVPLAPASLALTRSEVVPEAAGEGVGQPSAADGAVVSVGGHHCFASKTAGTYTVSMDVVCP